MRPILPTSSVNQSAPSRPGVIKAELLPAVGIGNSVIEPAVVMRPILLPLPSVNQKRAVWSGCDSIGPAIGRGNRKFGIHTDVRSASDLVGLVEGEPHRPVPS
jgi:hypothetical protein